MVCACTCGVDSPLGYLLSVLEKLGLGSARVPKQQHVDIPAQPVAARRMLLLATKEGKSNPTFDVEVAVYGRRNGVEDERSCRHPRSADSEILQGANLLYL